MAVKNRILRRPGKGSAVAPSRSLIALLADPDDIEMVVRLAVRVGVPPLDELDDENPGDIATGVSIMKKMWPLYRDLSVEYCVKRYGPGTRPSLWWEGKRPFVKPYDWRVAGDGSRFEKQRAAEDLKYLREHGYLTKEEKLQLDEMGKQKRFGPSEEGG